MNLLVIGDLHGRIDYIERYYARLTDNFALAVPAVVQVGDFGFYERSGGFAAYRAGREQLPVPTYAVHGNHDDPEITRTLAASEVAVPNLHVFPVGGGFVTLTHGNESVTLMGVGGAYTVPQTWHAQMSSFSEREPEAALVRWDEAGQPAVDILITHETPSQLGRPLGDPQYGNPYRVGSDGIRAFWQTVRPRLLVCGHYHTLLQKVDDGLSVTVLPEAAQGALVWDSATGQQTMFTLRD